MTKVPFGLSEEGRLMNQDMARSRTAPHDDTAGASLPAGRAGRTAQRYEVRPVAWVEAPLKHRAQAPRQGSEGAPPAWLAVEPDLAEGSAICGPGSRSSCSPGWTAPAATN